MQKQLSPLCVFTHLVARWTSLRTLQCNHVNQKLRVYGRALKSQYFFSALAIVLGGVRFKYQAVRSGRTTAEDLKLGMERCDAIVCTGEGTGLATPFEKIDEFKAVVKDFPVIVGAGVTLETAAETFRKGDGAIIGSWFKHGHSASNAVNPDYVKHMVEAIRQVAL